MLKSISFNNDDNNDEIVTLSEEWLKYNREERHDYKVKFVTKDGLDAIVEMKRYGFFYCIEDSKLYDIMSEDDKNAVTDKYNEYYCVKRYANNKKFIHYTRATEEQLKQSGLKASESDNITLAHGVYCFEADTHKPAENSTYCIITYTGPYFECIYDPDPCDFDGNLIGKDGYLYKEDEITGQGVALRTDESIAHTEILLPVYNIPYENIKYFSK